MTEQEQEQVELEKAIARAAQRGQAPQVMLCGLDWVENFCTAEEQELLRTGASVLTPNGAVRCIQEPDGFYFEVLLERGRRER